MLESALEGEITDHVGYDKHDAAGKNSGNDRNGTRAKTVLTDAGPVEVYARIRKAVRARGHCPAEAAALKCVYMALMSLDPTGKGRKRWDHALEGTAQRLPDRLRRPSYPGQQLNP